MKKLSVFVMVLAAIILNVAPATAKDMSEEQVLVMWLANDDGLGSDQNFIDRYISRFHRDQWRDVRKNEFKRSDFLDGVDVEIAELANGDWKNYVFRTNLRVSYGAYDEIEGGFPLGLTRTSAFTIPSPSGLINNHLIKVYYPQLFSHRFLQLTENKAKRLRNEDKSREVIISVEWTPKSVSPKNNRIVADVNHFTILSSSKPQMELYDYEFQSDVKD